MNKSVLRVVLLVCCALLMEYSLFAEKHESISYEDGNRRQSGGSDYVKSVESGVLLRSKGRDKKSTDSGVYDAKTLIPEAAQIDDCPT